jgi:dynein light intermediate chain
MRKQLQAEYGKSDLEVRILELEAVKVKRESRVAEFKARIEAIQKRNLDRKANEELKREEELKFLKY